MNKRFVVAAASVLGAIALGACITADATGAPAGHGGRSAKKPGCCLFDENDTAGYEVKGFFTITATWTQPEVTCVDKRDAVTIETEMFGATKEKATFADLGVATSCASGSPVASAVYSIRPNERKSWSDPVRSGDVIRATASYLGNNTYGYKLADFTLGWYRETQLIGDTGPRTSAVYVQSDNLHFPDFGKVDFTDVVLDAHGIGQFHATPQEAFSTVVSQVTKAHAGPITENTGFTVTWLHE